MAGIAASGNRNCKITLFKPVRLEFRVILIIIRRVWSGKGKLIIDKVSMVAMPPRVHGILMFNGITSGMKKF